MTARDAYSMQEIADLLGVSDATDADHEAATTFFDAVRNQVPREVLTNSARSSWSGELGHRSPDGFMRTLALTLHVVRGSDATVDHYSVIARDVTEHKQLQAELQRQATHDELTGLPNRTLFLRRVAEALDRSRTLRRGVTVMFLDFDGLKTVNDTVGHRFGDQLIVSVGKRLVNATRPSDVVARLSGDEFAVLAEGVGDESLALEIAERLRASITGQHVIQGVEVTSGASVGIAIATTALLAEQSPNDAALTLLVNADTAMYRAKQRGKGRCEIYSEAMRTQARDRLTLGSQLERALARSEMSLLYQPIVSIYTGRVVAIEALLRWQHPERGTLTPPAFLDVAEETGAIGPIGDWVIATAARTLRELLDDGTLERSVSMHINVSPRQLSDAGFVERTTSALQHAGVDTRPHWPEIRRLPAASMRSRDSTFDSRLMTSEPGTPHLPTCGIFAPHNSSWTARSFAMSAAMAPMTRSFARSFSSHTPSTCRSWRSGCSPPSNCNVCACWGATTRKATTFANQLTRPPYATMCARTPWRNASVTRAAPALGPCPSKTPAPQPTIPPNATRSCHGRCRRMCRVRIGVACPLQRVASVGRIRACRDARQPTALTWLLA